MESVKTEQRKEYEMREEHMKQVGVTACKLNYMYFHEQTASFGPDIHLH